MSPAVIPPAIAPRIGALLRLLGSEHDGEALGAVRALRRTLSGVGLDLHALADAIERPAERIVIFDDPPEPRKRKSPRKTQPGEVVLDTAACRRVGDALWRALAGGRLSEWQVEFASSLAEQMQAGRCRLSGKQGDALKRLLAKVGESAAWA